MPNFTELNTFGNFIETDYLARGDIISRDLFNYVRQQVGGVFYNRNAGGFLFLMDNNENSQVYDLIIKVKFIEMVAKYNYTVASEYRVVTSADMIEIERKNNQVIVFLGFLPLGNPELNSLRAFPISFGA